MKKRAQTDSPLFHFLPSSSMLPSDGAVLADARRLAEQLRGTPPPPMPRNLRRADLAELDSADYLCAPKTDGERVALVLGADEATDKEYMVAFDRAMRGTVLPLTPGVIHELQNAGVRGPSPTDVFCGTLLDAERIERADVPASSSSYVVFDATSVGGFDVRRLSFMGRLNAAAPVVDALGDDVVLKHWHHPSVLERAYAMPGPPSDGLILMPKDCGGTIFKWKPVHTLDFLFADDAWWVGGEGRRGQKEPLRSLGIEIAEEEDEKEGADPKRATGVYECAPDGRGVVAGRRLFRVLHRRPDKLAPNHKRVVASTLTSIDEGLELAEVAAHFAPRRPPAKRQKNGSEE